MKVAPHFASALEGFDLEALDDSDDVIYGVDADMRLSYLNEGWAEMALENDADPSFFSIWDIGARVDESFGEDLGPFYTDKFERTRESGEPWEHEYLCHAPTMMRKFRMRILPLEPAGWLVIHTKVVEERRDDPGKDALEVDEAYRHDDGLFRQCSHCGRFRRPNTEDVWDWVPTLFADTPEQTSHGLCETCFGYYYGRAG